MNPSSSTTTRSLLRLPLFLLTVLLWSAALPAQIPGQWSDDFARPGITGRVFAAATWQGKLLAGGDLAQVSGSPAADLMELRGNRWHVVGAAGGIDGTVRALASFGGELIAGGELVAADGKPMAGVARWDGSRWASLGSGLVLSFGRSEVFALCVHGGSLYATGEFNIAGGVATQGIARWDGSAWHAVGGGLGSGSSAQPVGFALHSGSDGRLNVGGSFVAAGGTPAKSIAAWDGSSWSALGSGSFSAIRCFAEFQGQLHAGGDFSTIGGVSAQRIARFDGSAWHPLGSGLGHASVHSQAFTMQVQGGELLVGGKFTDAGGIATGHVAAWDGAAWRSLGAASGSAVITTVLASTIWNGQWVTGGEFDRMTAPSGGARVASESIAAWDGGAWNALGTGLGAEAEVRGFARYQQELLAFGRFATIGEAVSSAMARFDGRRWLPFDTPFGHQILDAVEFQGDLVVAGEFHWVGGMPWGGVARWNGSTWAPMASGISGLGARRVVVHNNELYAAGYGAPERWTGSSWQPLPGAQPGTIHFLESIGGLLHFGGATAMFSAVPADVFTWDGTSVQPVGGDFNGSVLSLCDYQGTLIAGGDFTDVAGTPAQRLAAWNGTAWVPYGPGFAVGSVEVVQEFSGWLAVAGNLGGNNVHLMVGGTVQSLSGNMVGAVLALQGDPGAGQLWIGGLIQRIDGLPCHNLARYDMLEQWRDVGGALRGSAGEASLSVHGAVPQSGGGVLLRVRELPPMATGFHIFGYQPLWLPVLHGSLVPSPDVLVSFQADMFGAVDYPVPVPPGIPVGTRAAAQTWYWDGGSPVGFAATNGVRHDVR